MADLSKLSDADLQAIAKNDWSKVSEAGLQMLSGGQQQAAPEFGAPPQLGPDGQFIQQPAPAAPPAAPQPSMGEQFMQSVANIPQTLVGAAETATTLATGATTAPIAGLGGLLKQYAQELIAGNEITSEPAQRRIQESAEAGFRAGTYVPQTRSGQQIAGAVGEALAPVGEAMLPLTPLMGGAPAAMPSARAALPAAAAVTQEVIPEVVVAAKRLPGVAKVTETVAGPKQSMGAALTPQALQREVEAASLPVPIKLTKGQKTRAFEEQQFEREIVKDPDVGDPIRQRFAKQNAEVVQNLDAFIDETGAEAPDLRTIGIRVDEALRSRAARDKVKIRTLYKAADNAGETSQNVEMQGVVSFLNENIPETTVAPVLKVARDKAIQLGLAREAEDGTLIAMPGTLKNGELWRRSVRKASGEDATNLEFARDLHRIYDAETADLGGNLYKQARAARARFARDFEDIAIVSRLMKTKRGSADRAVALENVIDNTVLGPTSDVDSLRHLRKVLQTQGDEGKQAWRELQGGLVSHIRDQITQSATKDMLGNTVVSADKFNKLIAQLDKSGKLDFIYGKKGAEQLRTLNEISRDIFTAPPGSVNTSGTVSGIRLLLDSMASGYLSSLVTGDFYTVPAMTAMKELKNWAAKAKQRRRVEEALK